MSVKFLGRTGLFHRLVGYETIQWSTFEQAVGDRIVYVSSSTGVDSGSFDATHGSITNPFASINYARNSLRDGYADWLLLKKGDTFSGANNRDLVWTLDGRSTTQKMVVGSYGTGARPKIDTGTEMFCGLGATHDITHLAFVGLEIYPGSRTSSADGDPAGFGWTGGTIDILWEDMYVHGYHMGLNLQGYPEDSPTVWWHSNLVMRGCVIKENFGTTPGASNPSGLFVGRVDGLLIDFCTFDHNGYIADTNYNWFRHNVYLQTGTTGMTIKNSLLVGTDGIQMREGGTISNNVFSRLQVGAILAGEDSAASGVVTYCNDNVFLEGRDPPATGDPPNNQGGEAIKLQNLIGGSIQRNIISKGTGTAAIGIKLYAVGGRACENVNISNNIISDWGGPAIEINNSITAYSNNILANNVFQNPNNTQGDAVVVAPTGLSSIDFSSSSNIFSSNGTDLEVIVNGTPTALTTWLASIGDTGSVDSPVTYTGANYTLGTYYQSIGGSNDHDAFMAVVDAQNKDNWNPALTAPAVASYIRIGFA